MRQTPRPLLAAVILGALALSTAPQAWAATPVVNDDAATTKKNQSVTVAVLANDFDPDGEPLALQSVGPPTHGSAVATPTGSIAYEPAKGFSGIDAFTYEACDPNGSCDQATVGITVRRGGKQN